MGDDWINYATITQISIKYGQQWRNEVFSCKNFWEQKIIIREKIGYNTHVCIVYNVYINIYL